MTYDPNNWYWLADDARVYGSSAQTIVTDTDAGYVAWTGDGNIATPWPRDDAGNQTDAALQDVLTPHNVYVDLAAYAAYVRYNLQTGGFIVTSLSPVPFNSDPVSINAINTAYDYALANGSAIFQWKMSDGSFITVNKAKITTMQNDATAFTQSCYTCESTTVASINGGTITTQAQVDAAFAAISNVFP